MAPWIRIRYDLFRQLQNQVQWLVGPEDRELRQYREEFESDFEGPWQPVSSKQLFKDIAQAEIIFLGDFHALQQSQKAHLRILRHSSMIRPRILAVEFFHSRHQNLVDLYMDGSLSEIEFLEKIKWEANWGFPWENYRPILRYAQKHNLRVFGINSSGDNSRKDLLKQRDKSAAEKILEIRRAHPEHQIFVVIGDLHIASMHLPKQIEKMKKRQEIISTLSIFQNPEKVYFKLLEKEEEVAVDIVQMGRGKYGLVSVPPWVKWQNYLMFLEQSLDRELHSGVFEYTDHVGRYLNLISSDFSVVVPRDHFAIYTADDNGFWDLLVDRMDPNSLKLYRRKIQMSQSFFVPEVSVGYLARPTVNHASQLAMSIFHAHLCHWQKTPKINQENFSRLIWLETIQYFGTKIINPKRKTETILDMRASLASRTSKEQEREALQLALHQRMKEVLFLSGEKSRAPAFRPRRSSSYSEAARFLGGILGERLFTGLRKRILSPAVILKLLRHPVDGPDFNSFYMEFLEIVEGLPEPFLSKADKM